MNNNGRNLSAYNTGGIEIFIDAETGESFASQRALARMCNVSDAAIRKWIAANQISVITLEIKTQGGLQGANLVNEDGIFEALANYNSDVLAQFAKTGIRVYLHRLAGYAVTSEAVGASPKSQIDLAMSICERVSLLAGLSPAIAAQLSLQAALTVQPQLAASLEPTMQALINSTANGDNLLSAKQLGDRLEISAQKVNKLLIEKGLQYKNESKGSSKEADYIATELGKEYSRVTQSAKGGSTFQQLRWLESVLEVLEAED